MQLESSPLLSLITIEEEALRMVGNIWTWDFPLPEPATTSIFLRLVGISKNRLPSTHQPLLFVEINLEGSPKLALAVWSFSEKLSIPSIRKSKKEDKISLKKSIIFLTDCFNWLLGWLRWLQLRWPVNIFYFSSTCCWCWCIWCIWWIRCI